MAKQNIPEEEKKKPKKRGRPKRTDAEVADLSVLPHVQESPAALKGVTTPEERSVNLAAMAQVSKLEGEFLEKILSDWCYVTNGANGAAGVWYKWVGTHWALQSQKLFESYLRKSLAAISLDPEKNSHLIMNESMNLFYGQLASNARILQCQDVRSVTLADIQSEEQFDESKLGTGVNFLNGFYNIQDNEMVKERPKDPNDLFLTSVTPVNYQKDKPPDVDVMLKIWSIFGYSKDALWVFRSMLHRCLVPNVRVQTGVFLHGPPESGKSLLMSLAHMLVRSEGTPDLTTAHLAKHFTLGNIVQSRVMFFSEMEHLIAKTINLLKSLLGRDIMSAAIKYIQQDLERIFFGTILATSNSSPEDVLSDAALKARFIPLQTRKYPGPRDPELSKLFKANASGIISWVLQMDPKELDSIIRANAFYKGRGVDGDVYARFINEYLIFEQGAVISTAALTSLFNEKRKDLGYDDVKHPGLETTSNLLNRIINTASQIWDAWLVQPETRSYYLSPSMHGILICNT